MTQETETASRPPPAEDFHPKQHMTRWFEPLAMLRLVYRIWATRRMADQRDQHSEQPTKVFDYAQTEDEFWFDYVADLGDAFDPTMCIAWHLGRTGLLRSDIDPRLRLAPEFGVPDDLPEPPADDIPPVLPRGHLLIMGGDEVYPIGTVERYRNQTLAPYRLAWEDGAGKQGLGPADALESGLLALPANHDWYGGIEPFRETFCSQAKIGGWRTAQRCSWWAARLPHHWWVWGVDTALDGTINPMQFEYFRSVRDEMPSGARLIVCTPVPLWRLRERRVDHLDNLARFFYGLGVEPEVHLAGDYHIAALHRRTTTGTDRDSTNGGSSAGPSTEWHLTAGGGGAFQHPVHNLERLVPSRRGGLPEPEVADDEPFRLVATWPSNRESREGTGGWWQLLFDRAAGSLIATLTVLQLIVMALSGADNRSTADNARSATETLVDHLTPVGGLASLVLTFVATFLLARPTTADRGATSWARLVGLGHGVAQSVVFVTVRLLANLMVRRTTESTTGTPATALAWLTLSTAAVIGSVASIIVLGSYLRFANRQFRMHDNESYSARHSGDNRHFARFRIATDGSLCCYVIAFRRTGRDWINGFRGDDPLPPPTASKPELINVRFRTAAADRDRPNRVGDRGRNG